LPCGAHQQKISAVQMSKTLALIVCGICAVSAFVQPGVPLCSPAQKLAPARTVTPGMMLEEADIVVSSVVAAGTLLASNAGDFGGYTIPIIGLGLLAAVIGILAGPVED